MTRLEVGGKIEGENEVEYEIGKKYIVADVEEDLEDEDHQRILVAYLPNTAYPFICVDVCYENEYKNGEKYSINNWVYAKPALEKKYKAYSEFDNNWINKEIKAVDTGCVLTIVGKTVGKGIPVVRNEDGCCFDLPYDKLVKYWFFVENGSVCGDLIK